MTKRPGWLACRKGGVAIATALAAVPLMLAVGLGTDLARAYLVQLRLSYALDAAGLAAGSANGSAALGRAFFDANFKTPMVRPGDVSFTFSEADNVITVDATAKLTAGFMQLAGRQTIPVAAESQITRKVSNLEVALVLDNTGSLYCCTGQNGNKRNNIQALRAAAGALAINLFGSVIADNPGLRVAVVPYNGAVNAVPVVIPNGSRTPAAFAAALTGNARPPATGYTYSQPTADYSVPPANTAAKWLGCVEESASFKGLTARYKTKRTLTAADLATALDAKDSSGIFYNSSGGSPATKLRWADGSTPKGPNRGCPVPVTPLTNDRAPILATIGVNADGSLKTGAGMSSWNGTGTNGALGVAWAYRVLSPTGPYAGVATVNPWVTEGWQKAVVLMTDGANTYGNEYTGIGAYDPNYGEAVIVAEEKAVCDLLRSNGVTIFSVFLNSNSSPDSAISYCAGKTAGAGDNTYFYDAEDQVALSAAFADIGQRLSALRVSR